MQIIYRQVGIVLLALLIPAAQVGGQKTSTSDPSFGSGDTPAEAGPLATDLSPALTPEAVAKAMRKVGDWELAKARPDFSQDWTFAALYRGFLAAADSLSEERYRNAMLDAGKKFDWKLGPRATEADDHAIGYMYLALYRRGLDAKMLEPTKSQLDRILSMPNVCTETCPGGHDQATPVWWWCDSLFMGPPVWAELYRITGEKKYLDHIDREVVRLTRSAASAALRARIVELLAVISAVRRSPDRHRTGRRRTWVTG